MILDQFGQPFDLAALREPQTARVAMLPREWATHPAKGLTPARLAAILQEAEQGQPLAQLDLADDMLERDGHVFSELDKRAAVVAAVPFQIAPPPNASAAEKRLAEQVAERVAELPIPQIVRSMMDAVLKSVSGQEMRWAMEEGWLVPAEVSFYPTRGLCPDEKGQRWQLRDGASPYGQPLLPGCWLLHRHRSLNGYLSRDGLVRVLAWPHLFKWSSQTDWMEVLEILGIPMRLGTYPTGASAAEKSRLMQAVVGLGRNAAGIMPAGMKIDLVKGAEGTEGPYTSMMDRMEAVQSKVIVGQTLTSGEGQHGTQALGNVHNEVRMDIRDSDLAQLAVTLTQQLLWPMVALNVPGIEARRAPRWQWLTDEAEDIKAFSESVPKLVGMGMRVGLEWAHGKLKIPLAEEGQAVLTATSAAPTPEVPPAGPAATARAKGAMPSQVTPAANPPSDPLDGVLDDALNDWRPMLAPMVEPLLAELDRAIAAGESAQAFRDRVPALLGLMDPEALGSGLADAAFKANLTGAADLDLAGNESTPVNKG